MLVYLEREDTPASWVTLLGWSALVQLIVNLLVGQGPWRRIYWVVWLPFVPLALWPGLPEWLTTPRGLVTLLVLTPLALLACRRARENRQFVSDVAVYLRSAVLAMLLAYVAYGLFEAILWSTVVIFGFSSDSDDLGRMGRPPLLVARDTEPVLRGAGALYDDARPLAPSRRLRGAHP